MRLNKILSKRRNEKLLKYLNLGDFLHSCKKQKSAVSDYEKDSRTPRQDAGHVSTT